MNSLSLFFFRCSWLGQQYSSTHHFDIHLGCMTYALGLIDPLWQRRLNGLENPKKDKKKMLNHGEESNLPECMPMRSLSCSVGLWRMLNVMTVSLSASPIRAISLAWFMPFLIGNPETTI